MSTSLAGSGDNAPMAFSDTYERARAHATERGSFAFYVPAPLPPPWSALSAALGSQISCAEGAPAGQWEDGFHYHFYLAGRSTRGVEVVWERARFVVRVFSGADLHDHALAVTLAETVARRVDARVEPDDGNDFAPGEAAGAGFGVDWIQAMAATGAARLIALTAEHGSAEIPCALRPFYFGARTLARLGPLADPVAALHASMRRVQFPDEDLFVAPPLLVTPEPGAPPPLGASDQPFTMSPIGSGVSYFFAPVDRLSFVGGSTVLVPYLTGLELLGSHVEWLDDKHVRVNAVPEDEWDDVLLRARVLLHGA